MVSFPQFHDVLSIIRFFHQALVCLPAFCRSTASLLCQAVPTESAEAVAQPGVRVLLHQSCDVRCAKHHYLLQTVARSLPQQQGHSGICWLYSNNWALHTPRWHDAVCVLHVPLADLEQKRVSG
jgi:hypothetical protein